MTRKIIFKKNLKENSKKWVRRQLSDIFYIQAKKSGFRSRSAFKLIEIEKKFKIFKNTNKILDLGSAPGSWCQVALMSKHSENINILGVDKLKIQTIKGANFFEGDLEEIKTTQFIKEYFKGSVDLILSDMAPNTIGHKQADHLRILNLVEIALDVCEDNLKKEGVFVCKIFQGGAQGNLYKKMKEYFYDIKYFKPKASRNESTETYLIAKRK